jgi:hypothetical protein
MTPKSNDQNARGPAAGSTAFEHGKANTVQAERKPAKPETGGPSGPEPTRYGDWERGGRCIDF